MIAAADLYADVPLDSDKPQAQPNGLLTFEGILVRAAEVRTSIAADGLHSQPIVCLELRPLDKSDRRVCMAQIPFTDATRRDAEACAKAHKKGMVITVASHPLHTRLVLPQARIINSYSPS